jgi:hypothetical protein
MNTATPSTALLECYLLLGQSNMAGRGVVKEEDKKPVRNIRVFDAQDKWVNQGEPIHYDCPEAGAGLGMAMAKERIKRNPEARIGLIPCAVGGTPLALWQPGTDLYLKSIRRAKLALSRGILGGFLWHQGENDSLESSTAHSYAVRLAGVVSAYREDLAAPEVPFLAGELGRFLEQNPKTPFANLVNRQIHSLVHTINRFAVISSEGLGHGHDDPLHFDANSLQELGRRYERELQSIFLGSNGPSKERTKRAGSKW